jgi:signal transduction histidine kinase/CheY-like chemotaxis protein
MIPNFRLNGWSIRSRLVVVVIGVAALLLVLSREPVRRIETDAMVEIMRDQYVTSLDSLVPALQDHVITRDADMDLPVLQRIAADFQRTHPAVLSMRIEDSDGNVLVERSVQGLAEGGRSFEVIRVLRAGKFAVGRVELVIDMAPIEAQAGRHVIRLQALFATLLVIVAVVLGTWFYRLTVSPLRKLDKRLRQLVSGEDVPEAEFDGAEEFLRLNDSVNALASAVQLQERQNDLELQLQQAQKMEAIGRLAGGVAHDFNNLLTVILGYAETLAEDPSLDASVRDSAGQIVAAGERAASLTRQLLAFSRKQVLRTSVVDPVEVLRNMEGMLDRLIGELVEVSVEVQAPVRLVDIDSGQFEQVLLNLAVNARDAVDKNGRLKFTLYSEIVSSESGPKEGFLQPVPPGEYVVLSLEDNGSGMDRETQERIFEPFFTTKDSEEGTGLGLAMVYGIVSQSGGFIDLESELGQGSTFRIYLPAVDGVPESSVQASQFEEARECGTILVVEDEALVRTLTTNILESSGYRVLAAEDSEAAVRIEEAHSERIDLLVTDLVLPGMSGIELGKAIGERRPEMGILLVSGYDNVSLASDQRDVPFLQKPFDRSTLLSKVREVLDSRE